MSDRGSNFQKAFKSFNPLFCFGHRLNNVLKRGFFQTQKKKKKKTPTSDHAPDDTSPSAAIDSSVDLEEEISTDESDVTSDEDFELTAAIPVLRKKKNKAKAPIASSRSQVNLGSIHMKLDVNDVPLPAKQVLCTLKQCKKVVKYVKKVSRKTTFVH